jgi:putative transposase
MRRSRIVVLLHFVWATYQRLPLIADSIEEELYQKITEETLKMGASVIAIGGTDNHFTSLSIFPRLPLLVRL